MENPADAAPRRLVGEFSDAEPAVIP